VVQRAALPLNIYRKVKVVKNDNGLLSRILTKWTVFLAPTHDAQVHMQSWRVTGLVRKVQVLSMHGGTHELSREDILAGDGLAALTSVLIQHNPRLHAINETQEVTDTKIDIT
jgi:hypothetical protein